MRCPATEPFSILFSILRIPATLAHRLFIIARSLSAHLSPPFSSPHCPLPVAMRTGLALLLAAAAATLLVAAAPPSYRSGERLLFSDEFDEFDLEVWEHELTLGGGGNWEFQVSSSSTEAKRQADSSGRTRTQAQCEKRGRFTAAE